MVPGLVLMGLSLCFAAYGGINASILDNDHLRITRLIAASLTKGATQEKVREGLLWEASRKPGRWWGHKYRIDTDRKPTRAHCANYADGTANPGSDILKFHDCLVAYGRQLWIAKPVAKFRIPQGNETFANEKRRPRPLELAPLLRPLASYNLEMTPEDKDHLRVNRNVLALVKAKARYTEIYHYFDAEGFGHPRPSDGHLAPPMRDLCRKLSRGLLKESALALRGGDYVDCLATYGKAPWAEKTWRYLGITQESKKKTAKPFSTLPTFGGMQSP